MAIRTIIGIRVAQVGNFNVKNPQTTSFPCLPLYPSKYSWLLSRLLFTSLPIGRASLFLLLISFFHLFNFLKQLANCPQIIRLSFLTLTLQVDIELVPVLDSRKGTFSWFLVFLGKKALRMWKSVPYLRSRMPKSSISSAVQTFDFSLLSIEAQLEIDSVSLQVLTERILFFFCVTGGVL
jgi:hypothetical protein